MVGGGNRREVIADRARRSGKGIPQRGWQCCCYLAAVFLARDELGQDVLELGGEGGLARRLGLFQGLEGLDDVACEHVQCLVEGVGRMPLRAGGDEGSREVR